MREALFAVPLLQIALAAFWILTGVLTLMPESFAAAVALVADAGFAPGLAKALVAVASVADTVVGAAFLLPRWVRRAGVAQLVLSTVYLIGLSLVAPALWTDHFGPSAQGRADDGGDAGGDGLRGEALKASAMESLSRPQVPACDRRRRLCSAPGSASPFSCSGRTGRRRRRRSPPRSGPWSSPIMSSPPPPPSPSRSPASPRSLWRLWLGTNLDRRQPRALCAGRRLLASGRGDPDQDARSRRTGGGGTGDGAAASLSSSRPPLVLARLAGLSVRARDLLADDRQAGRDA